MQGWRGAIIPHIGDDLALVGKRIQPRLIRALVDEAAFLHGAEKGGGGGCHWRYGLSCMNKLHIMCFVSVVLASAVNAAAASQRNLLSGEGG